MNVYVSPIMNANVYFNISSINACTIFWLQVRAIDNSFAMFVFPGRGLGFGVSRIRVWGLGKLCRKT